MDSGRAFWFLRVVVLVLRGGQRRGLAGRVRNMRRQLAPRDGKQDVGGSRVRRLRRCSRRCSYFKLRLGGIMLQSGWQPNWNQGGLRLSTNILFGRLWRLGSSTSYADP